MTYLAEHSIARPPIVRPAAQRRGQAPARRPHCRDARWPQVAAALAALRAKRRSSVRIVDADCGAGTLLLCAVRFARALGFTAIEARGVAAAPVLAGRARAAAAALHDPAIGITFEAGDLVQALRDETDFPADIVMWHGCAARCDATARREAELAIAGAGRAAICDRPPLARAAA